MYNLPITDSCISVNVKIEIKHEAINLMNITTYLNRFIIIFDILD